MAFLEDYFDEWKPVSLGAGIGWLAFYALFVVYAVTDRSGFLFLDFANLSIHEAGHPTFSPFGDTMMILGGTLAELLVPFACIIYFFWKREIPGTAFCSFWFFENFLYIGYYMADARDQALPRLGNGDHDWAMLFGRWGLIQHDVQIGYATRRLGWAGMLLTAAWFGWHAWSSWSTARDHRHYLT